MVIQSIQRTWVTLCISSQIRVLAHSMGVFDAKTSQITLPRHKQSYHPLINGPQSKPIVVATCLLFGGGGGKKGLVQRCNLSFMLNKI